MFIFKDTKKRANPYAQYTDAEGTVYPRIPLELLEEIPEPTPPEDYSDKLYFRTEQDDAPYVVYSKKSDQMIYETLLAEAETNRANAYRTRSDVIAMKMLTGRATQEELLAEIEAIKAEFPDPVKP